SKAIGEGQIDRAHELLMLHGPKPGTADLRGFEWRYLWQATKQDETVQTLAGLPRSVDVIVKLASVGDTLYNIDESRSKLRAWNMTDGTPLPSRLASIPP